MAFLVLFTGILVLVNLGFYAFLSTPLALTPVGIGYAWLLEFVALGLAYECAELVLILCLRSAHLPKLQSLDVLPRVALVCVTCDDVDQNVLAQLSDQTYPRLSIFVLDDSRSPRSVALVDAQNLTTLRRGHRRGYKAGNLNHWLRRYGPQFEYFVVADADSTFPSTFVEEMVRYAEHPANARVAIFESLIEPWNTESTFVRLQGVAAQFANRRKLTLDNRFCAGLSVGHNNLYRTAVVLAVGGFDERYIAEDYATSLSIARNGKWRCCTVAVPSYERLPANVAEYARRQARWAFQSFQLTGLSLSGIGWTIRLKLLHTLHHYSAPSVGIAGMALLTLFNLRLWSFARQLGSHNELVRLITSRFFVFWVLFFALPFFLRAIVHARLGVRFRTFVRVSLFHSALFVATSWPITRRVSSLALGDRLGFNATGRMPDPSLLRIARIAGPSYVLVCLALLSLLVNPVWAGLNLAWLLPAALSPLLLFHCQRSRTQT